MWHRSPDSGPPRGVDGRARALHIAPAVLVTPSRHWEKAAPPAEVGEVIGGYRLDAVIARGGMGCVFAATHLKLERKVAIKVLLESLANDALYVERFFHEARIVNAVRHPNIIDIYDFMEVEEPHRVAYVMELLDGQTLKDHLAQGPMTETQTANVALQLASALEAVHEVGVVHRDLKPANVIIVAPTDSDLDVVPSIKLLDFGVAKRPDWLAKGTAPGRIAGTPAYMSPEQIDGQVSSASDVYALGAIVYEMLSGTRLFRGDPREVMLEKLGKKPVEVVMPPDLHAGDRFATLIRACLEYAPEKRPSLPLLVEALEQILVDLTGKTKPAPAPQLALVPIDKPWPKPKPPLIEGRDATLTPEMTRAIRKMSGRMYIALAAAAFVLAGSVILWAREDLGVSQLQGEPPVIAEALPAPQPAPDPVIREQAPVKAEVAREALPEEPVQKIDRPRPRVRHPTAASREEAPSREAPREVELELEPAEADPLKKDDIQPW